MRASRAEMVRRALSRRGRGAVLALVLLGFGGAATGAQASRYSLANHCYAVAGVQSKRFLTRQAQAYRASARTPSAASAFYLKPTALGVYML